MQLEKYLIKTKNFIPLTYMEVLQNRPLIIKLSDDWNFVSWLQKAVNFAMIIDRKDYFLLNIEHSLKQEGKTDKDRENKDIKLLTAINLLISMLYEISKAEYKDKEKEYWHFLQQHFLDNTDVLFDVWAKVLEFNSRIGKKNAIPHELCNDTRSGSVDRWRGFFNGRRKVQTTPFLKFLHEDEERSCEAIRSYKKQKADNKRNNKGNTKIR